MLPATLSIDLDDLWTYRRSFGYPDWQRYDSFLDRAIPRFIELKNKLGLEATAFIVGHDASMERNTPLFRNLAKSGLEVGNHSFWHEHRLQTLSTDAIDAELSAAEDAIATATGTRPVGFRGPAFSTSSALLHSLMNRNYLYDASAFPTSIGPLARMYQRFRSQNALGEKRDDGPRLYGDLREARGSLKPFFWHMSGQRILEIPVTTMPFTRLPIHMTYVHFLADRSVRFARGYFKLAMHLCRKSGVSPSLLLHATDFVGSDDPFDLDFVPGMARTNRQKSMLTAELLSYYQASFDVTGLGTYARQLDPTQLLSKACGTAV